MTDHTNRIEELVAPALEGMGMALVRVRITGTRSPTLQIMIEREDDKAVTVEDCALASLTISALLDIDDPLSGSYTLEVSSPGVDRPLVRPRDFERFAGFEAKVELRTPVSGRKRFRGRLLGIVNDIVRLSTEAGEAELPIEEIDKAKLILTDDLLAVSEAAMIEHEG